MVMRINGEETDKKEIPTMVQEMLRFANISKSSIKSQRSQHEL